MAASSTCQLLSTVYGTFLIFFAYFLYLLDRHPPSAEYIHSSTIQKNMAHENTSQRAMHLAKSEEVNVRNIAKGA